MKKRRRRNQIPPPGDRVRRWLFWAFLATSMGAVAVTRGHDSAWPMVGWTMYWRVGETPDVVRTIRVDAVTEDGERLSYLPSDPLTHVERPLVERVMWQSFDTTAARFDSRRFLVRLLEGTRPSDRLRIIEGYILEWDVPAPPSLRRFSRDEPDRQIAVGAFPVDKYQ